MELRAGLLSAALTLALAASCGKRSETPAPTAEPAPTAAPAAPAAPAPTAAPAVEAKADSYEPGPYAPPAELAPPVGADVNATPGTIPPEVEALLPQVGKMSKAFFVEYERFPIGDTGLVPTADCCTAPDRRCPVAPPSSSGPFADLEFAPEAPHQFRYSYRSVDGKSFVARAVGDEDCDGKKSMFELWGYTVDGQPAYQIKKWY